MRPTACSTSSKGEYPSRIKRTSSKTPETYQRRRTSDALWRNSMACYFDMLRLVLLPHDREKRRTRGRAKAVNAAVEYLELLEATVFDLLDGTLQGLSDVKDTFRRIIESGDTRRSSAAKQGSLAPVSSQPRVPDEASKPYTNHRRKLHGMSAIRTSEQQSPLCDITNRVASVTDSAIRPDGYKDGSNSKVITLRQPVILKEELSLEGSVAIEEMHVIPNENVGLAPLETFDYSDDEQIVPDIDSAQDSYLHGFTEEPLNLKVVKSGTMTDPVLASTQQEGNSSPTLPLSAFSDIYWSSAGWASGNETPTSSQEVPQIL